jgi:hypothetical protein
MEFRESRRMADNVIIVSTISTHADAPLSGHSVMKITGVRLDVE